MTGLLHDPALIARHNNPNHPENNGRLALFRRCAATETAAWRAATDAELLAVHTPGHLQRLAVFCAAGGGMLDPDTYCGLESEMVARTAAGSLIDLCRGVMAGGYGNGLALLRPPGHHATADRAMGFCLYNSVAVAAAALRDHGVPRVAIVDFDVHHGNGTQDIFYADRNVLYVSSHQFPHYPGSGAATESGQGPGCGTTLNHPLAAGAGDDEFLAAYRDNLLPAVAAFRPGLILVSAGFDAHADDPLAGLNVSTKGFGTLARLLVQTAQDTCGGKIVFALEGGYEPGAMAACLAETIEALAVP